jgi:hypothetical protein
LSYAALGIRGLTFRELGPEAKDGDVGLVAVLLEEHPLQDLRAFETLLR